MRRLFAIRSQREPRWLVVIPLVVVLALIAAACGDGGTSDEETTTTTGGTSATTSGETTTTTGGTSATTSGETTTTAAPSASVEFSADLVQAAEAAALATVGGEAIGGTVEVQGHNGGFEADLVVSALKPFADATGIDVQYTGGSDLGARVETRVRAGDPPDIVQDSAAGNLVRYAKEGLLVAVDQFIDPGELQANFSAGMLGAVTVDGTIYGVMSSVHPQMVWYNARAYEGPLPPANWDELIAFSEDLVAEGRIPWCMALSAGPNTGFPDAYLIEEIFVKTYGAEKLTAWAQGDLPWTSPEVKDAFERFGIIGTRDEMVYPGIAGSLAAPTTEGPIGLFADPPNCQLFHWGEYTEGIIKNQRPELVAIDDIDFYPLPGVNPEYALHEQASGWAVFAFNDIPQVRALLTYWASAEFQSLLASAGSWVQANNKVPPSAYSTPLLQKAAQQFVDADDIAFGPFFAASTNLRSAFLEALINYMQDPGSLDAELAKVQEVADSEA